MAASGAENDLVSAVEAFQHFAGDYVLVGRRAGIEEVDPHIEPGADHFDRFLQRDAAVSAFAVWDSFVRPTVSPKANLGYPQAGSSKLTTPHTPFFAFGGTLLGSRQRATLASRVGDPDGNGAQAEVPEKASPRGLPVTVVFSILVGHLASPSAGGPRVPALDLICCRRLP
jgi:hypothetical protein